jgi:hypothetical protein
MEGPEKKFARFYGKQGQGCAHYMARLLYFMVRSSTLHHEKQRHFTNSQDRGGRWQYLHPLRRTIRLRHGRWQRCAMLVHAIASCRAGARGGGGLLVSGLSAAAYR